MLEMEDIKWKQRAKRNWYRHGDRNTKFFHAWANHRRKKNFIDNIQDETGAVWTEEEHVDRVFVEYFQQMFSTVSPVENRIVVSLMGVPVGVTTEMNNRLLREFSSEEVFFALSQMQPLKSPGPDGFSACFFQHWAIVGKEVCKAVLGFLNFGIFDAEINATYLALIPKVSPPKRVADFQPISLCNV